MDKMDAPVTRRELKEELALTRRELREEFGTLREEFGTLREEFGTLRGEFGTLRGEFGTLREEFGTLREDIAAQHRQFTIDMGAEIARQFRAANEQMLGWIRGVDDQYRDLPKRVGTLEELPDRVKKLEEAVFASPPRKRRRKAS